MTQEDINSAIVAHVPDYLATVSAARQPVITWDNGY